MNNSILVIAGLCIVVIILLRITMKTPVVSRFLEHFISDSLMNSVTTCPKGYTMYMYDGGAYCCKGRVNSDAPKLERSCIPAPTEKHTLCSLGPTKGDIPNCAGLHKKILQEHGKTICPPSIPNFCRESDSAPGRCCSSAVNETGTNCVNSIGSCSIGAGENEFLDPTDCRLLRLKEMDSTCPIGYHQTIATIYSNDVRNQSQFNGTTLYGCTNLSNTCYTQKLIQRLKTLGYDTRPLTEC